MSRAVDFLVGFNEGLEAQGYKCEPKCCAINGLIGITGVALFIIGCIGAAGAFPGSTIGWVTVGLAGSSFVLALTSRDLGTEHMVSSLIATALITVGVLGGTGILSATQVGWGILGTSLAAIPLNFVQTVCIIHHQIGQQRTDG